MTIELPISKSIANRVLIRKALRGEDVRSFTDAAFPEDVRLMARCLSSDLVSPPKQGDLEGLPLTLDLANCGTAMRFLTAYFAQKEGADVILDGCERMHHRPIGQEVDALRQLGADIEYLGQDGFPPLHIRGQKLSIPSTSLVLNPAPLTLNRPASTQFVSALLLIGADVQTDSTSPYIEMTRAVVAGREEMEPDWSAAAFWLERHALGLCPEPEFIFRTFQHGSADRPELCGGKNSPEGVSARLCRSSVRKEPFITAAPAVSLQGDAIAPQIFARIASLKNTPLEQGWRSQSGFGFEKERLAGSQADRDNPEMVSLDCSDIPDLVPAIAVTCRLLHLDVTLTGTESLRLKESDRLEALEENFRRIERKQFPLLSFGDHRIAMAFMAAGLDVDDTDCIRKSYPRFVEQLRLAEPLSIA